MYRKKAVAATLAAAMVMGSSLTAFAADPTFTGSGSVEGHVEMEVINMVLPTVADGTTAFAYTIDPERLVQKTDKVKYGEDAVFPDAADDTGVYFQVGENTYANSSNALQAVNKSNCDVTLTVKVKTEQNTAKDIALAASNTVATTGTPDLYLGLKVGKTGNTVLKSDEQTVAKTIPGTPNNFEVVYTTPEGEQNPKYVYQEKALPGAWKAIDISLTGAVSNMPIEADTTAPTVSVTWSFAKAADGVSADTSECVDYTGIPATSSVAANLSVPATGDVGIAVTIGQDGAVPIALESTDGWYSSNIFNEGAEWGVSYDAENKTIVLGSRLLETLRTTSHTFRVTFKPEQGDNYTVDFTSAPVTE